MKKICPTCLNLYEMPSERCPQCGIGLVDVESWKRGREGGVKQTGAPAGPTDENRQTRIAGEAGAREYEGTPFEGNIESESGELAPEAMIYREPEAPKHAAVSGFDRTKFVLGVLLSSLAFFLTFLAAYITMNLT